MTSLMGTLLLTIATIVLYSMISVAQDASVPGSGVSTAVVWDGNGLPRGSPDHDALLSNQNAVADGQFRAPTIRFRTSTPRRL
jgi:hypothetical protein